MEVTAGIPTSPRQLALALEGWIHVSREQSRAQSWKPLYQSGVRYQREPRGRERWQTAEETRSLGHGDCEDLVIARVAELREAGEDAARPLVYRAASSTLHTVVQRADGTIEDPSKILGMGTKMGEQPSMAKVEVTSVDGGKRATIRWRNESGNAIISVSADAVDEASAGAAAAAVARQVYEGLEKQASTSSTPSAIESLLPPQAALAIRTASTVAKLVKSGQIQRYASRLKGPAKRLARLFGR